MKAITVWQPFTQLIAEGCKQYETRCWATSYRGKIAIHAAKKYDLEIKFINNDIINNAYELLNNSPVHEKNLKKILDITQKTFSKEMISRGAIVAIADLTDCIEITQDYTVGRYAWKLENVNMLDEPIPAKGNQRLWEWEGEQY